MASSHVKAAAGREGAPAWDGVSVGSASDGEGGSGLESDTTETDTDGSSLSGDSGSEVSEDSVLERIRGEQERGVVRILVATADFAGENEGDLSFSRGDEFEWAGDGLDEAFAQVRAVAPPHAVGQVPLSFMREAGVVARPSAAPAFVAERHVAALVDAQRLPSGFRVSRLAALARVREHTLADALRPRLAPGGLGVADLAWDRSAQSSRGDKRSAGRLARHRADVSVLFELAQAQNVPVPPACLGMSVVERRARLCVMHTQRREIVGNIHLVRGACGASTPARWGFGKGGQFPGGTHGDNVCLVRFSGDAAEHVLVAELSYLVTYRADADTAAAAAAAPSAGQAGGGGPAGDSPAPPVAFEMSCGWTGIPLSDVPSLVGRAHDQPLAGGCPTDRSPVDLHAVVPGKGRVQRGSILRRGGGGGGGGAAAATTVSFRFSTPRESWARVADELPTRLVADLASVPLLCTFRASLLDALSAAERMRAPGAPVSAPPLYDPAVSTFLELCTDPVALGVFRNRWRAECKSQKHRSKRKQAKHAFRKMLTHRAVGFVRSRAFRDPAVSDAERASMAQAQLERGSRDRAPPATPFDVRECVVGVVGVVGLVTP